MATIKRRMRHAAWKLAQRYNVEAEEIESLLHFYFTNALHHHPFEARRGGTEDAYRAMLLANCIHRVSRELNREVRRQVRTVSLDELTAKMEEVCND